MMKLAVVLLFTATTVFAIHKLHNYNGPCKKLTDHFEQDSKTCKSEIHDGTFVIPDICAEEIQKQIHEIIDDLNKKYPGAEMTEVAVVEHANIQFCVVFKWGLIKDDKFDYDGFIQYIKEKSLIEDEKAMASLIASIESVKAQEEEGKGLKEMIQSDIFKQICEACEIKEEHYKKAKE